MAEQLLSSPALLTAFFTAEHLAATARRTGVVQRASKITGKLLLALVTFGVWREATTTLAPLAAKVTPLDDQREVSPEAIYQRRHTSALVFLQELISQARAQIQALEHGCDAGLFPACTKVYLAARTGFALPNSGHDLFPGAGGSAAKAGATMQAVGDYKHGVFDHFALTPWTMPDQKSMDIVVALAKKGVLFLVDLGYVKIKALARIADAGAYCFSRLNQQTTSLHTQAGRLHSLEWASVLAPVADHGLETPIFLGAKARVACRLVASRGPASMVNTSRRNANKQAQKKG